MARSVTNGAVPKSVTQGGCSLLSLEGAFFMLSRLAASPVLPVMSQVRLCPLLFFLSLMKTISFSFLTSWHILSLRADEMQIEGCPSSAGGSPCP